MAGSRELRVVILGDATSGNRALAGLQQSLGEADRRLASTGERFKELGGRIAGFGAKMTAGVTLPIAFLGKKVFDAASDMGESLNKVGEVFGDVAGEIEAFAQNSAKSLGMSRQQTLEATGTFGNLFTAMGLGQKPAADLSRNIVTLASDLASFNNIGTDEALEKLRSGLVGEIEPLRALGVSFNAANVEAKALEMGLADANGELSEGAKVQARYALIMEQTRTAQGDFARTAGGAANQQRILRAQFEDTAATLGNALLPIGQQVLGFLGSLAEKFNALSPTAQQFVLIGAGLLAVVGPLVTAIGGLVAVVGFLISPVGLVIAGIAALAAGLVVAYNQSEVFRAAVDRLWQAVQVAWDWVLRFADGLVQALGGALEIIQGLFNVFAGILRGNWGQLWDGIQQLASGAMDVLVGIFRAGWQLITGAVQAGAGEVVDVIWSLPGRIWDALGDLGGLLYNAGRQIISGLWNGLIDAAQGMLNWVSGLGRKIASLKGPLDRDRTLLVPAGHAIMQGLVAGLHAEESRLLSELSTINGMIGSVGGGIGGRGGVGLRNASTSSGPTRLTIEVPVILEGREIARVTASHTMDEIRRALGRGSSLT